MLKSATRGLFRILGYDIHRRVTHENVRVIAEGMVVDFTYRGVSYRMFVSNANDSIQLHHAAGSLYEVEELEMIARKFRPGGVFLDIGANVGNHAIFAAKALDARKVLAFEPASPQRDILAINVTLNDLGDRVSVFRQGLSSDAGVRRILMESPRNIGMARISAGDEGEMVTLARGDDVLGDSHVDFIKIDVEGHEINVLNGLESLISTKRPVIFAEVDNDNSDAFSEWVRAHGYRIEDSFKRYAENNNYLIVPA